MIGYGSAVSAAPPGVASPGAAADQGKTVIRLGALIDQTGSSTTPLFRSAVELAAAQMNAALDRAKSPLRFQFVFGDTRSDPALTRTEALKLINQDGVTALLTDSSGDTVAANRLNYDAAAGASHKAAITCFQCSSSFIHDPNATESDPAVQQAERDPDRWTFRVFYNAKYEAAVILRVALAKLHKQPNAPLKISIFADGGHKSFAAGIAETLPALAGNRATSEIVYVSKIDAIGKDWARLVDDRNETTDKTDGPPDLVVVAMLPAAATEAIKTYRQGGYTIPILSNNSFRRDYILAGIGKAADGLEGSSVGLVDRSKSGTLFVNAFRTATHQQPEVTGSGAYDSAVTLMLAALVAQGNAAQPHAVTPEALRLGLTRINDRAGVVVRPALGDFVTAIRRIGQGRPINYEGAYDPLNWDAAGEIYPPLVHWKVQNGRFVEDEAYDCGPAKPLCARR